MTVDLHSHTTASDGVLSPKQLVTAAVENKVDVLAVTDHDTVDGIADTLRAAKNTALTIIPGIEISCFVDHTEIHILGIGINPKAPGLRDWLKDLMASREERAVRILAQLAKNGIELDPESVLPSDRQGSVGRPHVARALIAAGYVSSMDEAFTRYLLPGRPGHVDRNRLPAQEAIGRIRTAGGIAIQAHPGGMGQDTDIPQLVRWGLDGLEVYHYDHSVDTTRRYEDLARSLDLLVTGGSDFHGDPKGHGTRLGSRPTPDADWRRLVSRAAKRDQSSIRV